MVVLLTGSRLCPARRTQAGLRSETHTVSNTVRVTSLPRTEALLADRQAGSGSQASRGPVRLYCFAIPGSARSSPGEAELQSGLSERSTTKVKGEGRGRKVKGERSRAKGQGRTAGLASEGWGGVDGGSGGGGYCWGGSCWGGLCRFGVLLVGVVGIGGCCS